MSSSPSVFQILKRHGQFFQNHLPFGPLWIWFKIRAKILALVITFLTLKAMKMSLRPGKNLSTFCFGGIDFQKTKRSWKFLDHFYSCHHNSFVIVNITIWFPLTGQIAISFRHVWIIFCIHSLYLKYTVQPPFIWRFIDFSALCTSS